MELTIQVVTAPADKLNVLVHGGAETTTVLALKQLIEQQNVARFPVAAQRLIFQGQILQDDKLLSEYNISPGMALHLTLAPGVAATIAAAAAAEAAAPPGPSTVRAAFASLPPSTRAPSAATLLRQYLQQMQAEAGYETAIQTMQKICENIVGHPTEDKYRKLRVANAALKARLFDRSRGMDCLKLLGFQEGVEQGHLVLVPNAERWENLTTLKRVVDEFANTPVPSAVFGGAAAPTGGFPGAFGGQGTANLANMAAQASAMMQNPMMAQMISSHPMMQQMAQANPMIAQALQNPAMLQQMLGSMQSNPMMMQQLNQMMQDPNAMQQMQQMMGGINGGMPGGGGGFPAFPSFGAAPAAPTANPFASAHAPAASNPFAAFATPTAQPVAPAAPVAPVAPAAAAAAPPAPVSTPAAPSAGAESLDTTYDEDEIAQAIARSLEEH